MVEAITDEAMDTAADTAGAPDSCRLRLTVTDDDADGAADDGEGPAAEGIPNGACLTPGWLMPPLRRLGWLNS